MILSNIQGVVAIMKYLIMKRATPLISMGKGMISNKGSTPLAVNK
jgi:hypothetical protein